MYVIQELAEAGKKIVEKSVVSHTGSEILEDAQAPTLKLFQQTPNKKIIFSTIQVIIENNKNTIWQVQIKRPLGSFADMEKVIVNAISERPAFKDVRISYL